MNFPENLKYTKDHEWIRFEGEYAFIGITDFAQRELGDIVYVDVDKLNEEVAAGEVFGTVEAVKTVSDLFMPVDGTIVEVNKDNEGAPESINQDPYGKGWMIKIKLKNPAAEANALLDCASYKALVQA